MKRAFNSALDPQIIELLHDHSSYGFNSAGDFISAAVRAYAQSYQHPGGFDGALVRAIAREESTKQVAKLGIELREHIDSLFERRKPSLASDTVKEHVKAENIEAGKALGQSVRNVFDPAQSKNRIPGAETPDKSEQL